MEAPAKPDGGLMPMRPEPSARSAAITAAASAPSPARFLDLGRAHAHTDARVAAEWLYELEEHVEP